MLFQEAVIHSKYKPPQPDFELGLLIPFSLLITLMQLTLFCFLSLFIRSSLLYVTIFQEGNCNKFDTRPQSNISSQETLTTFLLTNNNGGSCTSILIQWQNW